MTVRAYNDDSEALWRFKKEFEQELGAGGSTEKAETYAEKLTPEYRERYVEWVERCLSVDPECIQLAVVDDEPVGYIFVLPETHAMIWDAGVINELYLAPEHRGTGLADALLEAGLAVIESQSLPLSRVILDVSPENERAQAVYERHGFTPWAELVVREL